MNPTDEQSLILDAYKTGENLVIEAGAGTGKTSTLRFISKENTNKKGLYLAFNKSIADEATTKFDRSVLCKTAHSMAYAVVGKNYKERLNAGRVKMSDIAKFLGINNDVLISEKSEKISTIQIARIAVQTVDRFCYSADNEILGCHVPKQNGISSKEDHDVLKGVILPLAKRAWADLIKPEGVLKFNHDYYLKIWAMSNPKLKYDYILLDESQDTNPVLSNIISSQKDSQIILVGDRMSGDLPVARRN